MPWVQSSEFSINNVGTVSVNLPTGQAAAFAGIVFPNLSANTYIRLGYLWVLASISIPPNTYQTRISVGPIWFQAHRYPINPTSIISAVAFRPSRQLPLPQAARVFWFVP